MSSSISSGLIRIGFCAKPVFSQRSARSLSNTRCSAFSPFFLFACSEPDKNASMSGNAGVIVMLPSWLNVNGCSSALCPSTCFVSFAASRLPLNLLLIPRILACARNFFCFAASVGSRISPRRPGLFLTRFFRSSRLLARSGLTRRMRSRNLIVPASPFFLSFAASAAAVTSAAVRVTPPPRPKYVDFVPPLNSLSPPFLPIASRTIFF